MTFNLNKIWYGIRFYKDTLPNKKLMTIQSKTTSQCRHPILAEQWNNEDFDHFYSQKL